MRILMSGSTGLVGSALIPSLKLEGHHIVRLVRPSSKAEGESISWDPEAGQLDSAQLEGFDAVIHLAGEGIADRRWSAKQKAKIRNSRVDGTKLLSEGLARIKARPKSFLCASAIGYYGNRGDETLDEQSASGSDFLAEVCRAWEAAADPARNAGIRVTHSRLGVILSTKGGALATMLTPFKLGAGGVLGDGRQYMSWVAIDDVVGALLHELKQSVLSGPVNVVAPRPVTNEEFTKTLGRVLSRPTILPMPAFAARLAFGEMADALLLSSAKVLPRKLNETGYAFQYPELEGALRHLLG